MTWEPAAQLIQENLDFASNPADSVTYFTTRIASPQSAVLMDWAESKLREGDPVPFNLMTFLFDVASTIRPAQEIFVEFCSVGTASIDWPTGYGFEGFISEPMTVLEESGDESDAPAVYAEAVRKINEAAIRWFDQDFLEKFIDEFNSLAISYLLVDDEDQEPEQELELDEENPPQDLRGPLARNVEGLEELLDDEGLEELQRERERLQGQQPEELEDLEDLEDLEEPQHAVIGDVEHPDPQNAVLEEPQEELEELEETEELEDLEDPQKVVIGDVEHPDPQNAVLVDGDDNPLDRLEELIDEVAEVVEAPVDQEKVDALADLSQGGQKFVNDNYNAGNLKGLPEDKKGDNPDQIIVFEGYVLIGTNHAASYYNAANRLGVKGEIWISAKGGVFDPGTVKVRGIPLTQQGFVEAAIKGFSKKKVEFV